MVARKIRSSIPAPIKGGSHKQLHRSEPSAVFLATDFTDNLFADMLGAGVVGHVTIMLSAAGVIALDKDGNGLCEIDDDLDGLPEHILSKVGRC